MEMMNFDGKFSNEWYADEEFRGKREQNCSCLKLILEISANACTTLSEMRNSISGVIETLPPGKPTRLNDKCSLEIVSQHRRNRCE
jgi:hypothetical protein